MRADRVREAGSKKVEQWPVRQEPPETGCSKEPAKQALLLKTLQGRSLRRGCPLRKRSVPML